MVSRREPKDLAEFSAQATVEQGRAERRKAWDASLVPEVVMATNEPGRRVLESERASVPGAVLPLAWPDPEPVSDWSHGAPQEKVQALVEYWRTDYDWRRCERELNSRNQCRTEIDCVEIHFGHNR